MNLKINYNLIIFLINFYFLINYFNFVDCYQDDQHLFSFVQEFKVRRSSRFTNLSESLHSRFSSHHHLDFLNDDDDLPLPRRLINNFKSTPSSFFNQFSATTRSIFNNYNNNRYNNNYNSNFNSNYNRRPSTNYPTTHADYDSFYTTYRPYRPINSKPIYKPSNIKPITSASIASSYVKPTNVKPTFNQPTKPTTTKYIAECACKHRKIGSNSLTTTTTDSSITSDTSTFSSSTTNATIINSDLKVNRRNRSKDKNYVNLNALPNISGLDTKIVNGTVAQYYKYPWTVSLGRAIDGKYTNESHYCGATLISPQWVLSAGHCVTDFRPKKLIIAFGSGDRTKMTHFIEAEKWVVHPEFSGWPKYLNDIALVKLKQPVVLNGAIKPACLHSNYIRLNKEFEAIGWGRLGVEDDFPTQLQKTKFNYVTTSECKNRWSKQEDHPDISVNNICVFNPSTDICGGDSGSPLQNIAEDGVQYVVGVASFTNFCDQHYPAVYVRIYPYIQWIVSVVKDFC